MINFSAYSMLIQLHKPLSAEIQKPFIATASETKSHLMWSNQMSDPNP